MRLNAFDCSRVFRTFLSAQGVKNSYRDIPQSALAK